MRIRIPKLLKKPEVVIAVIALLTAIAEQLPMLNNEPAVQCTAAQLMRQKKCRIVETTRHEVIITLQ